MIDLVTITTLKDFKKHGANWLGKNNRGFASRILLFTDCERDEFNDTDYNKLKDAGVRAVFKRFKEVNFSKFRNEALKFTESEWALNLDIDEVVLLDERDYSLINQNVSAVYLGIVSRKRGKGCNTYHELPRLHKTDLKYVYRVHETIEPNITGAIAFGYSTIFNEGYITDTPEERGAKRKRNCLLIARDMVEQPENMRHYKELERLINDK